MAPFLLGPLLWVLSMGDRVVELIATRRHARSSRRSPGAGGSGGSPTRQRQGTLAELRGEVEKLREQGSSEVGTVRILAAVGGRGGPPRLDPDHTTTTQRPPPRQDKKDHEDKETTMSRRRRRSEATTTDPEQSSPITSAAAVGSPMNARAGRGRSAIGHREWGRPSHGGGGGRRGPCPRSRCAAPALPPHRNALPRCSPPSPA